MRLPSLRAGSLARLVGGILLLLLLGLPQAYGNNAPLGINTASVEPFVTADRKGFLDQIVAEIFRRTGRQAQINSYKGASARSIKAANSGQDDGEALRIKGQSTNFPNLIMVPESILKNNFVAYTLPGTSPIKNWQDLAPYQVGHIIGWWIFKKNTTHVKQVTEVRTPTQMFSLLKLERLEVALYEKWQGLWVAKTTGVPVMVHEPSLAQVDMFMYLHKKHSDLVPKASQALVEMKADGTYNTIYKQVLETLLPRKDAQ